MKGRMRKTNNTITASGLMSCLRDMRTTLAQLIKLAKKPVTTPMLVTIYEDEKGEYVAMRFSDQSYFHDEERSKRTIYEWTYEVTSKGISVIGFSELQKGSGLHTWQRETVLYWSHQHEESSTIRLIDLPRGKYGPHCELIRKHFSTLPAWAWAVMS